MMMTMMMMIMMVITKRPTGFSWDSLGLFEAIGNVDGGGRGKEGRRRSWREGGMNIVNEQERNEWTGKEEEDETKGEGAERKQPEQVA